VEQLLSILTVAGKRELTCLCDSTRRKIRHHRSSQPLEDDAGVQRTSLEQQIFSSCWAIPRLLSGTIVLRVLTAPGEKSVTIVLRNRSSLTDAWKADPTTPEEQLYYIRLHLTAQDLRLNGGSLCLG
jgi:hypothetical protein